MMVDQEKLDILALANSSPSGSEAQLNNSGKSSTQKLRIGKNGTFNAADLDWDKLDHAKGKDVNEITIPLSLERIMNYEWFPEDLLFHPIEYTDPAYNDTIVLNSKGRRLDRIPKTEGTPDDLLPILVEAFNNANSKIRIEMINYIKWLESDCGFKEKKEDLAQFFCEKVSVDKITDSEDVRVRLLQIMYASHTSIL